MARRRKRRGCLGWGCLVVGSLLLVVVLLIGWIAAVQFRVPERLGLRKRPAERLLSGTPDREAAEAFLAEFEEAGVSTEGMALYVIPVEGKGYNLAVAVLDASQGFRFERAGEDDVVLGYFKRLATGEAADEYRMGRVAIHYLDENGEALLSMTAPTEAIQRFARGEIGRQELMQAMERKIDLESLSREVLL